MSDHDGYLLVVTQTLDNILLCWTWTYHHNYIGAILSPPLKSNALVVTKAPLAEHCWLGPTNSSKG